MIWSVLLQLVSVTLCFGQLMKSMGNCNARETGEAASATVELNAGGFSGETIYSTTFAKNMRIDW